MSFKDFYPALICLINFNLQMEHVADLLQSGAHGEILALACNYGHRIDVDYGVYVPHEYILDFIDM